MRLFIALDIDEGIQQRIARFVEAVQPFAPEARWLKSESLHVTLKFIGEQPESSVEEIMRTLRTIPFGTAEMSIRGYGFFPNATSPRVFWIGMEAGPALRALAAAIDKEMASLGIPKDARPFSPHLTLARGAGGSGSPRWRKGDAPNPVFQRLLEKLSAGPTPEFGSMTPREFFLYQSHLSPKGSKYTKLSGFALT